MRPSAAAALLVLLASGCAVVTSRVSMSYSNRLDPSERQVRNLVVLVRGDPFDPFFERTFRERLLADLGERRVNARITFAIGEGKSFQRELERDAAITTADVLLVVRPVQAYHEPGKREVYRVFYEARLVELASDKGLWEAKLEYWPEVRAHGGPLAHDVVKLLAKDRLLAADR
ncbi:MAG: hypothetical protein U0229_12515 [Anaeromyxobacter sp.]